MRRVDRQAQERYLAKLQLIREGAAANPFESCLEREERIERAKKDIKFFVEYYYAHYATSECAEFQIRLANRIARDKTCRELVRWARGLGKSVWCDLIIPMWLWVRGENLFMVLVGNTYDSATELLSDIQAEFEANARIIHDFGDQQLSGSWKAGNFTTRDGRFHGVARGMRQSVRGLRKGSQRPNYITCDDLEDQETQRNPKRQDDIIQWIENDLLKTMDGPVRRYLHPNNDPYERSIQNQLEKRHPDWRLDIVKAYDKESYEPAWPEKYTADYYIAQEHDGILSAHAEFLHEPLAEGKIFTADLIQWARAPRIDHFKMIIGHWDVAYSGKNDFNAIKVWGLHGMNFWNMKAFVRQCKMEDAIRWMYDYEEGLPKGINVVWRVESQFWNDPVKQAIEAVRKERNKWLSISIVDRPSTNKFTRIISMHPYYQNGRIYYDEKEFANGSMQTSLKQLYGIEPSYRTHDDAPDADEQAISFLSKFVSHGSSSGQSVIMGERRRSHKF